MSFVRAQGGSPAFALSFCQQSSLTTAITRRVPCPAIMEELKPLAEIWAPDIRSASRGFTPETLHELAAARELNDTVPMDVRHLWEIARHAYVYSSLYTPLSTAAELYAAIAVEGALRIRLKDSGRATAHPAPRGLHDLLRVAIAEGWIADKGFAFDLVCSDEEIDPESAGPLTRDSPADVVARILPRLRNGLAHGSPRMTLEFVDTALLRASEIINQLYPRDGV
jgi:hypothetical protein